MNNFMKEINAQLQRIEGVATNGTNVVSERIETGGGYQLHMYEGSFHRVPKEWRFP
jgi:hypothetical protein